MLSLGADLISECFQAVSGLLQFLHPAPALQVLMLVLQWVWGGSCSSPRVPRNACSHGLSTSHCARGRAAGGRGGPDRGAGAGLGLWRARGWACSGRRLRWQAVCRCRRHLSLLPTRWAPPGALARGEECGDCRCSHGATAWAPTLPLKAPAVRQEHRPRAALIQTREASISRLKRDGRDYPVLPLLGPRWLPAPPTPLPSPALTSHSGSGAAGGLRPVGGWWLRVAGVEAGWLFKERQGGCTPSGPERLLHS